MAQKKQTALMKRRVKRAKRRTFLWLVPHSYNNYRPHLIRRYGLLAVLVVAVALQFGYNYTQTGSVLGRVTTVTPGALLIETNTARETEGLRALAYSEQLAEAAKLKARDMLARQYWAHVAPDGSEAWELLDRVGYQYVHAGENLARDFRSPDAMVTAWLGSEDHRANVLNDDYTDVGFAVVDGELDGQPVSLAVALYGTPATVSVASVAGNFTTALPSGDTKLTPAVRVGVALQSLTPAAMTSLALLFVAATVAVTAHIYRRQLPKRAQKAWHKKYHGAVKAAGLLSVAAFIVLLYGGGQL